MRDVRRHAGGLRPHRGFTLTELLVVIGVIALLIGILLPTLSRAREASRKTQCLANLKTLGEAHHMYAQAWNGKLPDGNPYWQDPVTKLWVSKWDDAQGQNDVLAYFANQFVKAPATFHCPSDVSPQPAKIVTADYELDDSAHVSFEFYSIWFPGDRPAILSKLKGRAPLVWDQDAGEPVSPISGNPLKPNNSPLRNHKGGGNVVYSDGHAEWLDRRLWEDQSWPKGASEFYPTP